MNCQTMNRWLFACLLITFTFGCRAFHSQRTKEYSKIVFLSNRDAPKRQFDIFMMNPDGSQQENLTKDLSSVRSVSRPLLSPSETKILFIAFEQENPALQLLDFQSRTIQNLTGVGLADPQASFNPQGDKLVFVKRMAGRRQIHVIHTDGSGERNLSGNKHDEFDPAFSADGSKLIFVSKRAGANIICTMDTDGSSRKQLTTEFGGHNRYPVFSPDGAEIAFSTEFGQFSDIYLMKNDGTNLKKLTNSNAYNTQSIFSPDGSKITFLSNQRGMKYRDICIMDTDGKGFLNLTNGLNYINQHATFTPDGKSIIFGSVKFNNSEIYRVDINGQNLKNLTNHPEWDQFPTL
ncbi:MAG: TolB family protein [bacterium]